MRIKCRKVSEMGSCCNTRYLKSSLGGIKLIELISLTASIVTVFFFNWEIQIEGTVYSRVQFFLLVTMTSWIIEVAIFIMIATKLTKTLPIPWPLVNIVFGILFGIFHLIATGLLALEVASFMTTTRQWPKNNREWETITNCELISRTNSKATCLAIQGGAGFGLLTVIILLADIILNSRELKTDFYIQGPTAQSNLIDQNFTASTIFKE